MRKTYLALTIGLFLLVSTFYAPAAIAAEDRIVTFWEKGVGDDYPGVVCIINGVGTRVIDLYTCYTVTTNTDISFAYQSPLNVDSSKRYVWVYTNSDTTPPINTQGGIIPVEITGNVYGFYETQYKVSFSTNNKGGTTIPSSFSEWIAPGETLIKAIPESDYSFTSWTTTGSIVINNPTLKRTTATINGPGTIKANFEKISYTITPSVTGLGTVDPSLPVKVKEGDSQTFTLTPEEGYNTSEILVDGQPVQIAPYYTFTNVKADHILKVTFTQTPLTSVTIDSTPIGSNFVYVDGNLTTTPRTFSWLPGSIHLISAVESVQGESGVRYNFLSWSDGGAKTHNYTVTEAATTIVASYQTQYLLNVKTNFGSVAPLDGVWYNAGDSVSVSATAPIAVPGESYIFGGWKGSIGGYSGGKNPSNNFIMNGPVTMAAQWMLTYKLTIESMYGETLRSGWYEPNEYVTAALIQKEVVDGDLKAIFVKWSGDATGTEAVSDIIQMTGPKTAKAEWETQHKVTFSQTGLEGGIFSIGDEDLLSINGTNMKLGGLPYTSEWIADGRAINFTFKDKVTTLLGIQYVLENSMSLPSPVVVNSPTLIQANYINAGFAITWLNGLIFVLILAFIGILLYVRRKK